MAANTLAGLRHELDHDGCAYGQVTRERLARLQDSVDRVGEEVARVEARLSYVLGIVAVQFLAFFIGVVGYLLQRGR